ncbi:MAG: hypothetical protein K2P95_00090 [Hyphomonadaceae bacterium]|nr:hypothetical protein [Hyphomonadaceae bacterium]
MRLWYLFIPVIAITGANKAYEALRSSPSTGLTEVRQQCFAKASDAGLAGNSGVQLCDCMIGKVRWFKWTSFGAEYTREIHNQFAEQCVAQMTSTSNESSGSGVFGSSASRPLTGPGSGYGTAPDDEDEDDDAAYLTSSNP